MDKAKLVDRLERCSDAFRVIHASTMVIASEFEKALGGDFSCFVHWLDETYPFLRVYHFSDSRGELEVMVPLSGLECGELGGDELYEYLKSKAVR